MKLEDLTNKYTKIEDRNDERKDALFSAYAKTKTELGYSHKDLKNPKNIPKFINEFYKNLGEKGDDIEAQLNQKMKYGFNKNELMQAAAQQDNFGYSAFIGIMHHYTDIAKQGEKDIILNQFTPYNMDTLKGLIEQDPSIASMDVYKAGHKKSVDTLANILAGKSQSKQYNTNSPYISMKNQANKKNNKSSYKSKEPQLQRAA